MVPGNSSLDDMLALKPAGVFLSNGPGDPAATGEYAVPMIRALADEIEGGQGRVDCDLVFHQQGDEIADRLGIHVQIGDFFGRQVKALDQAFRAHSAFVFRA